MAAAWMSETVISAKGEGGGERERGPTGNIEKVPLLAAIRSMHVAPPWGDHGTLRFPSGSWRGLEGCPLFGSRLHLHRSSFPSLIAPTIFSARIWRGGLVVTAHRISTGTRGQKPWCLGCPSNDGRPRRPRRPRRHQICPHRHLIFSPPLPLAQHPWDCGFFRVASLADWAARKVFFMVVSRPRRLARCQPAAAQSFTSVSFRTVSVRDSIIRDMGPAGIDLSTPSPPGHRGIDRDASRPYRILFLSKPPSPRQNKTMRLFSYLGVYGRLSHGHQAWMVPEPQTKSTLVLADARV